MAGASPAKLVSIQGMWHTSMHMWCMCTQLCTCGACMCPTYVVHMPKVSTCVLEYVVKGYRVGAIPAAHPAPTAPAPAQGGTRNN